jgi:hypothetical protein
MFATLLAMGILSAGKAEAQGECTLNTIQGTYLFEAQGVLVDKDSKVLPYAEAGVWTLDGKGEATGIISASTNGVPFARRDAFTATYELSSNCVYHVKDQFGLDVDLFASPSGDKIMYFSPGFSGTMLKQ